LREIEVEKIPAKRTAKQVATANAYHVRDRVFNAKPTTTSPDARSEGMA
jgi:hypothetical protein